MIPPGITLAASARAALMLMFFFVFLNIIGDRVLKTSSFAKHSTSWRVKRLAKELGFSMQSPILFGTPDTNKKIGAALADAAKLTPEAVDPQKTPGNWPRRTSSRPSRGEWSFQCVLNGNGDSVVSCYVSHFFSPIAGYE